MKKNNTQIKPLAQLISELLRHPAMPERLGELFRKAMTDAFNEGDQSWVDYYESSPEYIVMVLDGLEMQAR